MAITVTKNGTTDISAIVEWSSIDAVIVLTKERGSFRFTVALSDAEKLSLLPSISDTITLSDTSGVIFGGTVTEIQKTVRGGAGILLEAAVTVTDYGFALDSKLVKASYADMDPADIVAALIENFGPGGYDYTTHVQHAGYTIKTISFNYEQLTKCLEALARQIGWDWYIDPDKKVHFFFATTDPASSEYNPAPITLDDTGAGLNWASLDVDESITNLKNSIYVVGGSYQKEYTAANTPDVYKTTAGTFVYPLAYKYTGSFFVTVDGVQQSIGIDQQDDPTLFEVLYNSSGPFLRFTSDPGGGHTVKTYGFAQIPIVAHMQEDDSITNFGQYEDAVMDSSISSVEEAQARALAEMALYGHPVYDVKFTTMQTGLRVGQVIVLNSPMFGVSNYPLVIKRVEAMGFSPDKLSYRVEAIGSDVVTFTDLMLFLLQQQNKQITIDPSTVIQVFQSGGNERLSIADAVTATATAKTTFKWDGNSKWGFATWG
jgi:hypothetical protein